MGVGFALGKSAKGEIDIEIHYGSNFFRKVRRKRGWHQL